jgi:tetraacyldisaccharide 4'-kinase
MARRPLFHRIADQQKPKSALESLAQGLAAAAAPVYGVAAFGHRLLHDLGVRDRQELASIVLSVGNITMGGSGKTPFTKWLARWLKSDGRAVAVLSRGYGREDEDRLVIVHDGRKLRATTREGGDEPVQIARALGNVPVIACSDRHRAGKMAERRFSVDTLVLDDGFQHHALARQGDIVLVDSTQPLEGLRLFPRGTLREPLAALGRAHLIVLTRCKDEKAVAGQWRALRARFPHVPVVRSRFAPASYLELHTGRRRVLQRHEGQKALLVCGVANPAAVRATAKEAGLKVVRMIALPDHAHPTKADLLKWDALRRRLKADVVVVTDKDAVKLREMGAMPEGFLVLRIKLDWLTEADEKLAKKAIRSRLRKGHVRGLLR